MPDHRLLYISPVVPAVSGNGLAMRAGNVLEALSGHVDISLLIVPLYAAVTPAVPTELARLCRAVAYYPLHAPTPQPRTAIRSLFRTRPSEEPLPYEGEFFDTVHVFRAATIPYAESYLQPRAGTPRRHLDLDDIESLTSQRIAALLRSEGREAEAVAEETRGGQSAVHEEQITSTFDRVYVSSSDDRRRFADRHNGTEICVLPNAIRLPVARKARAVDTFTVLFVGTLGYYPNVEALRFFCTSVLPDVRRRSKRRVRVLAVGRGATAEVQAICRRSGVDLAGAVSDIDPYYREADVAVAPVHAGGGTRIKILEAFSYGVPVVSTSIGAEGIDAGHEEHLLVADRPDDFASACLRLASDLPLAQRLSENALTLVRSAYSLDAMRVTIAALYSSPPHSGSR